MLLTIDQRLAALQKSGFKVTKYREIKSGTQYKVLTPKVIRKLWPVIIVRDSIEEAVAFAEGVAATWKVVQLKMDRQLAAIADDFGLENAHGNAHETTHFSPSAQNQRQLKKDIQHIKNKLVARNKKNAKALKKSTQ